jgi:hypothetical protein
LRQPPRDAGPLVVTLAQLAGEPASVPRATRCACPGHCVGDTIYVRVSEFSERPERWVLTTIAHVISPGVRVEACC